jgi:hypothetical protein
VHRASGKPPALGDRQSSLGIVNRIRQSAIAFGDPQPESPIVNRKIGNRQSATGNGIDN